MALRIPDKVRMASQRRASGVTPLDLSTAIETTDLDTATDQVALFQFPNELGRLWICQAVVPDLDSNGVPTLTLNFVLCDEAGVVAQTLVATSTIGQAGGTLDIEIPGTVVPPVVGGFARRYLAIDVGAVAATPQAGSIQVLGLCTTNV